MSPLPVNELETARFELHRLDHRDGRVTVRGRWHGVRGRRFVRPTLVSSEAGSERRALAELEHKPWAPDTEGEWVAVFPWTDPLPTGGDLELAVAPDLTIPVRGGTARSATRSRSARRPRAAPAAPAERDVAARDATRAARDAAIAERDAARAARDAATAARDAATAARDNAIAARDNAIAARDAAIAERDAARGDREAASATRDELAERRTAEQIAHRATVDRLGDELSAALAAATTVRRERDGLRGERDALRDELAARAPRPAPPARAAGRVATGHARLLALGCLLAVIAVLSLLVVR